MSSQAQPRAQSEAQPFFRETLLTLHGGIRILQWKVTGLLYPHDQGHIPGLAEVDQFLGWQPPLERVGLDSYQNLREIADPIFFSKKGSAPGTPGIASSDNETGMPLLNKVAGGDQPRWSAIERGSERGSRTLLW